MAVVAIWAGATILAAVLTVVETGSDPTRIPVGAIVAPIGAALLTVVAAVVARMAAEPAGT